MSVKANGYLNLRLESSQPREDVPLGKISEMPPLTGQLEWNLQLKVPQTIRTDAYADLSFLTSNYAGDGNPLLPSLRRNAVALNELVENVSLHEHLTLLAGKKRIVWGSGFAANPTDLLNPAKDVSDPTLQRAGAWLAEIEAPFAAGAVSAFFAPRVFTTQGSLPSRFLMESKTRSAFLAGARIYALVRNSDINLMAFHNERDDDPPVRRDSLGFSFSRYFFTDYEFHVEALGQRGSSHRALTASCVSGDGLRLVACAAPGPPDVYTTPDLTISRAYGRVLAGTRYAFHDSSILNMEYLWNGEGLDRRAFEDRVRLFRLIRVLQDSGFGSTPGAAAGLSSLLGGGSDAGSTRLSFEPVRRHYLFASYVKPQIRDDFTLTLTLLDSLEDRSGIGSASVAWSVREWVTVSLFAVAPFGGVGTEFGDSPQRFRVSFETKLFY